MAFEFIALIRIKKTGKINVRNFYDSTKYDTFNLLCLNVVTLDYATWWYENPRPSKMQIIETRKNPNLGPLMMPLKK